jgi:Flp pilus assembly protein TadG
MVESALALLVFIVLVAGIMQLGLVGAISNSVSFAAEQAARWASTRGSSSGHAATASDIRSIAQQYATPFNTTSLSVTVTWSPDNKPGSSVTVKVAYALGPSFLPVSRTGLNLQATASQRVVQ